MSALSKGLTKDLEILYASTINRAAAVFPIFDIGKVDLLILFQNYWKWKPGLEINLKIYLRDCKGKEIYAGSKKSVNVNKISLNKV